MKANLNSTVYFAAIGLITIGAAFQQAKTFPLNHTQNEWANHINGLGYIQNTIHQSNLPAREAFICDSVLQAQMVDIQRQIGSAILAAEKADTTKPKTKKP